MSMIKTNLTYALEGQDETPDVPRSPPIPEYHPMPLSDRTIVLSNNFDRQRRDVHTELIELRREVAILRQDVTDLTLQLEVFEATIATEADCLYQEIGDRRCQLAEARDSSRTKEPSTH